jgi:hypothetical protein
VIGSRITGAITTFLSIINANLFPTFSVVNSLNLKAADSFNFIFKEYCLFPSSCNESVVQDFDFDGIPDNNFVYYEYVSAKGLLKTEIISKNITLTTEDNPDSIGHADIKSERILTGVNF